MDPLDILGLTKALRSLGDLVDIARLVVQLYKQKWCNRLYAHELLASHATTRTSKTATCDSTP